MTNRTAAPQMLTVILLACILAFVPNAAALQMPKPPRWAPSTDLFKPSPQTSPPLAPSTPGSSLPTSDHSANLSILIKNALIIGGIALLAAFLPSLVDRPLRTTNLQDADGCLTSCTYQCSVRYQHRLLKPTRAAALEESCRRSCSFRATCVSPKEVAKQRQFSEPKLRPAQSVGRSELNPQWMDVLQ